jgi:hypothetical protein
VERGQLVVDREAGGGEVGEMTGPQLGVHLLLVFPVSGEHLSLEQGVELFG